jgi:hypothetical protein
MKKTKPGKSTLIFFALVVILLTIFIGAEYIKNHFINGNPRYTVGIVTDFKEYVRTYNNSIHYTYMVDNKQYTGKYRSRELPTDIKGKRIVVKFSNIIHRWNYPFYLEIVPDSIHPPARGWETNPKF